MKALSPGLLAALDSFAAQAGHRRPAQILAAQQRAHIRLAAAEPVDLPAAGTMGPPPRRGWWIRDQDLEA